MHALVAYKPIRTNVIYYELNLIKNTILNQIISCSTTAASSKSDDSARAPLKTELQVLRLSTTSQESILETLRHIHGPLFKFTDKANYKEMGSHIKKGYWEQRGNLVIQGVCDYSNIEKSSCEKVNRFKMLSISQLVSFGFEKFHCLEALDFCKGDVDSSIELLYKLYFPEVSKSWETSENQASEMSESDLMESWEGEKDALESIFDNTFQEKEPKRVWLLTLKIDHLLVFSESERKKQALAEVESRKRAHAPVAKKVAECRNFIVNGKCKYGTRCKFMHTTKPTGATMDPSLDSNWFYLEVRFPKESLYPYTAPIVALKTTVPDFPNTICLRITRKILNEAILMAQDGMPSVYTIADLLQNETEITEFLKNDRSVFLDPKRSIFYVPEIVVNDNNIVRKKLSSHYEKGKR